MTRLEQCGKMVAFLGKAKNGYAIPYYGLSTPTNVSKANLYRPNSIYRLYADGKMTYTGTGLGPLLGDLFDIEISLPNEYIERAFDHLRAECKYHLVYLGGKSSVPELCSIIKMFYGVEFLDD